MEFKYSMVKDFIIKLLGGYTQKEYTRIENKYQALLDSKSNDVTSKLVNEYIERTLKDLYEYARTLYGSYYWADKMYNVLKNNWLRVRVRYVDCGSSIYYKVDTTLDSVDQFVNILKKDGLRNNSNSYSNIDL